MTAYYAMLTAVALVSLALWVRRPWAAWATGTILVLFAGTRLAVDNDYLTYAERFRSPDLYAAIDASNGGALEVCMRIVPAIARWFSTSDQSVINISFLIFAILGVGLSVLAISRFSENFFLAVALFASYDFFVQGMTAIRANVASAIFLLSLGFLVRRKYGKFLLMVVAGLLFHASAAIYLVVAALHAAKVRLRYYYAAIFAAITIAFLNVDLVTRLHLAALNGHAELYVNSIATDSNFNGGQVASLHLLNFRALIALAIAGAGAAAYTRLRSDAWYQTLFRVHLLSVAVYFAFAPSGMVFATRFSEMLAVVECMLCPVLLRALHQGARAYGIVAILAVVAVQAYYIIDVSAAFRPYQSWLI